MKKNKYIGIAMMAAGMLAATSCTDFSDYNETPVDQVPQGNQTLWENIQQDSRLTDFAQLIRKSGYDTELNTPRSLTVWAPANGTFSPADYEGLSQEDLLRRFVKGHIAEYAHAASGAIDERVHMLNDKSFDFVGDGTYTFGENTVTQANIPSTNGLMHILDGAAQFYPNLYEYISTAEGIDSLRNYFKRYELTTLDESASVKGPMVNGVQTYIDSVMVTTNSLERTLNAKLENEDSSYTFVMPTNEAYMEMYNRVKPYYNFITETTVNDVTNYSSASDTKTKKVTVNASYMTDSLVRRAIIRNLVYSNNDGYNQWIVGKEGPNDTIRSTVRGKFSNPDDIMSKNMIGEPVEMSNGYARLVDKLGFYSWETYCPELSFSPAYNLANLFPKDAQMNRYTYSHSDNSPLVEYYGPDTYLTEIRYGWITPGGDRAKPDFCISMPNVMSTTYNFYVVFMGPTARSTSAGENRPNWLNFDLNYCDAKGKTAKYYFSKAYADSLLTGGTLPKEATKVDGTTAFSNDPTKVDTVFIGRFNFPVNYSGLGEDYYPSLHVTSPISVFNNTQLDTYSRDVRIAAILLRPVELDEFEAKNK